MITIVDAITGSGKSSWAIQNLIKKIKNGKKIIYVTPYLSEIERIKTECSKHEITIKEPTVEHGFGSKSKSLIKLMLSGANIATTHACFDMMSRNCLDEIKQLGYTLYMDEVHDVVQQYYLSEDDLHMLRVSENIAIDEATKKVSWIATEYNGKFETFKNLCDIGCMYYMNNTMYMWTFPVSVFEAMNEVIMLTYLFEGQNQAYYYQMYDLQYKLYSIKNNTPKIRGMDANYELTPYSLKGYQNDIKAISGLVNVYEGKLNLEFNLSSNWFDNNNTKEDLMPIKNNIYNYFRNIINGKSKENMWTTLKAYQHKLKGERYTKGFVEITARATNEYAHKENLAYVYDRFMNPILKNFFIQHGIKVKEEVYSASEIIQWVFRSRIRKGESINIYIPSQRMREIFKRWLNCEITQIDETVTSEWY